MRHKKAWVWSLVAATAVLVIGAVMFVSAVPLRSETLKKRIVQTLAERLNSDVSIDDLSLRVFPRLHAEGRGLTIRDRRRHEVAPLIAVESFNVDGDVLGVWRKRVAQVELFGLQITIPPDQDEQDDQRKKLEHKLHTDPNAVATTGTGKKSEDARKAERADAPNAGQETIQEAIEDGVIITTVVSENARLTIIPRKAGKAPKTWAIHMLRMREVGTTESMPFEAALTNAVPPGEIYTEGRFGPWDADRPGNTALDGAFTFDNADLSVFKGISGILASRGTFGGSLDYIDVNGETTTPDFTVSVGGHPFALSTKYHAVVDGTNGDTLLPHVDARFLNSTLQAKGAVLDGPPGQHGRTVSLDVTMPKARIEDVMKMAVKQNTPPMVGALQLTTKFLLPPGQTDVADRLRLNGRFTMSGAKFTNREVQTKIVELSHRGRGKKPEEIKEQVASDFKAQFVLANGRVELKDLMFAVPGAQVLLAGNYALKPETLAFKGNLLMDAKVSDTVSGIKSMLLKIVDPLFRKHGGGSTIPIKIEGQIEQPKFGLDVGRVFKRGN